MRKRGWAIPRFRLLKPLQFDKIEPKGNTVILQLSTGQSIQRFLLSKQSETYITLVRKEILTEKEFLNS